MKYFHPAIKATPNAKPKRRPENSPIFFLADKTQKQILSLSQHLNDSFTCIKMASKVIRDHSIMIHSHKRNGNKDYGQNGKRLATIDFKKR